LWHYLISEQFISVRFISIVSVKTCLRIDISVDYVESVLQFLAGEYFNWWTTVKLCNEGYW